MIRSSGSRRFFRDLLVDCLAFQPQAVKRWEFRHFQRYILWMLFRIEREEIVETPAGPTGRRFRMRLRWRLHTGYVLGLYELEVIHALREHLKSGDTCLDVGGHVGYLTILMAGMVGPSGKVISFEPMPDSYGVLEENVRLNHLENVTLERAAVGEGEVVGSLVFEANERLTWTPSASAYGIRGSQESISVPVLSIDRYVKRGGLRPHLIKIDVEGAELSVLQGARQMLLEISPVVIVEVHGRGGDHEGAVLAFLKACGYAVHALEVRHGEVIYLASPNAGEKT